MDSFKLTKLFDRVTGDAVGFMEPSSRVQFARTMMQLFEAEGWQGHLDSVQINAAWFAPAFKALHPDRTDELERAKTNLIVSNAFGIGNFGGDVYFG